MDLEQITKLKLEIKSLKDRVNSLEKKLEALNGNDLNDFMDRYARYIEGGD